MARRSADRSALIGLAIVLSIGLVGCSGGDPSSIPDRPIPPSPTVGEPADEEDPSARPLVPIIGVVDGDTFHVLRGRRDVTIRLIGIDTPEVGWYGGEAECYGARAGLFVRDLLEGEGVRLEFDLERIDPYGRTLAYAYLRDGRMVNVLLVRRGFAEVTIFEPNHRYEPELLAAEQAARATGAGLWSECA
jgi:micrococcal nuclease